MSELVFKMAGPLAAQPPRTGPGRSGILPRFGRAGAESPLDASGPVRGLLLGSRLALKNAGAAGLGRRVPTAYPGIYRLGARASYRPGKQHTLRASYHTAAYRGSDVAVKLIIKHSFTQILYRKSEDFKVMNVRTTIT